MIVNLTPHALNIYTPDGIVTIEASGGVARCAEISTDAGTLVHDGNAIPMAHTTYGDVSGLPEPKPNTMYIVSALVRLALPNRSDLASPGALVRDDTGQIIGAKGLIVNKV